MERETVTLQRQRGTNRPGRTLLVTTDHQHGGGQPLAPSTQRPAAQPNATQGLLPGAAGKIRARAGCGSPGVSRGVCTVWAGLCASWPPGPGLRLKMPPSRSLSGASWPRGSASKSRAQSRRRSGGLQWGFNELHCRPRGPPGAIGVAANCPSPYERKLGGQWRPTAPPLTSRERPPPGLLSRHETRVSGLSVSGWSHRAHLTSR